MSKIHKERVLVLAKTYPSPSARYAETSCVAGINELGQMRRLFPVPFRYLEGDKQFKKWQWVDVSVLKARDDHRKESYKISVDTVKMDYVIPTKNLWAQRLEWLSESLIYDSPDTVENARIDQGVTLAFVRPLKLVQLLINPVRVPDWTADELEKLLQHDVQNDLFMPHDSGAAFTGKKLRKLPYDFYYEYLCETPSGTKKFKHKIIDWEVGALFWNCHRRHGDKWEQYFRNKLIGEFQNKDIILMLGNIHRFANQWLIISLIYPPKPDPGEGLQGSLL